MTSPWGNVIKKSPRQYNPSVGILFCIFPHFIFLFICIFAALFCKKMQIREIAYAIIFELELRCMGGDSMGIIS